MRIRFLGSIVFVFIAATLAFADTFTVSKIADTADGVCDSDCSLREAVTAAAATGGDDTIVFDASVFNTAQTITLNAGEMLIGASGSLDIVGPGPDLLTIDAAGTGRIFSTQTSVVASITGMKLTGGTGAGSLNTGRGGAVYNAGGQLFLENLVIDNNTAANGGGLNNASAGVLTIANCVVSNNATTGSGGGMQNFSGSTINIWGTTFAGNTTGSTTGGGAGQLNGTANIVNSTFTGNMAPVGSGGAISSNGSSITITNSTFSENTSASNGGGLHRATTNINIFIRNSIFAGNTGGAGAGDVTATASVTSEGNNIIGVVGLTNGWIGSDLVDTDPMLGALSDNGGLGQTYLPQPGSPTIEGGQNCVLDVTCSANNPFEAVVTDQRGVSRPVGANVDIGAVEVGASVAMASGRVVSASGQGVPNAIVIVLDGATQVASARTNPFGYFVVSELPSGVTYDFTAEKKEHAFQTVSVSVNGDQTGIIISEGIMMKSGRSRGGK
ncbi:MAG: carboxypeptidase-like regulatory domain-containing protein [Pyrinomonadaceae bacterium]